MIKHYLSITSLLFLCLFAQQSMAQNKSLFFVFLNTNPEREVLSEEKVEALQTAHLENIEKLSREGKIVAAGPFEGGGGMFIIKASTLQEANEFLQTDPAINADRFILEVYPFQFWNGSLCEASQPYEMVNYQFCRLRTKQDSDLNAVQYNNRIYLADQFNNNDYLLCYGFFEDTTEGFAIFNIEDPAAAADVMKKHPAYIQGLINYEIKPLWIAKGTFCE